MKAEQENMITAYLQSYPRYRLAVCKDTDNNSPWLNMGEALSYCLSSNSNIRKQEDLEFVVQELLSELIKSHIQNHPQWGEVLYVSNLGILFEPELGLDINNLIEKHTKTALWIINWDGETDCNTLYLNTKDSKYKIDLSQINHIYLQ